ncbi:bacteriocin-like protein, partial [Chryseobacterium sp. CH1]
MKNLKKLSRKDLTFV